MTGVNENDFHDATLWLDVYKSMQKRLADYERTCKHWITGPIKTEPDTSNPQYPDLRYALCLTCKRTVKLP